MTIVELFVGYGATGDEDEAREIENALGGHPIVEMDELIARRAGTGGPGSTSVTPRSVRLQSSSTNRC